MTLSFLLPLGNASKLSGRLKDNTVHITVLANIYYAIFGSF